MMEGKPTDKIASPRSNLSNVAFDTQGNDLVIDVVLKLANEVQQMVPKVPVRILKTLNVSLSELFAELRNRGYTFSNGSQVLYYSNTNKWFVFCGLFPTFEVNEIPLSVFDNKSLILKVQLPENDLSEHAIPSPHSGIQLKKEASISQDSVFDDLEIRSSFSCRTDFSATPVGSDDESRPKRSAERKLSFVIKAVAKWRRLFKGMPQDDGTVAKYSLEDSARKVGISKKSLDDYLLQIRYGKKFGFDFQKHKTNGIGMLRAFNKKKREAAKNDPESRRTTPIIKRNRYKLVESEDEEEDDQITRSTSASSALTSTDMTENSRSNTRFNSMKVENTQAMVERLPIRGYSLPSTYASATHSSFDSQLLASSTAEFAHSNEVNSFFASNLHHDGASKGSFDSKDCFDAPLSSFFTSNNNNINNNNKIATHGDEEQVHYNIRSDVYNGKRQLEGIVQTSTGGDNAFFFDEPEKPFFF